MKHPLLWLVIVIILALFIGGFVFLIESAGNHAGTDQRTLTPTLVSGLTCLLLGTGLLVLSMFMFWKKP